MFGNISSVIIVFFFVSLWHASYGFLQTTQGTRLVALINDLRKYRERSEMEERRKSFFTALKGL
jgi:hypothetical protein